MYLHASWYRLTTLSPDRYVRPDRYATLSRQCGRRQSEPNLQAAAGAIAGLGRPAVRPHDLRGDGETDALAAGIAVARLRDPEKGLEYAFQVTGRHAGPPVANPHRDPAFAALHAH